MRKNLVYYLLLLILSVVRSVYSDSIETRFSLDGAYRFSEQLVYSTSMFKTAVSFQHKMDKPEGFFYGLLTSWMSIGKLDASGLAAEVESSSAKSVNSITESTFFSSNIRSRSKNGRGISISLPGRRMGIATVYTGKDIFSALWLVPLKTKSWKIEFLVRSGQLKYKKADNSWFPENAGRAPGNLINLSQRLIWQQKRFKSALTIIGSGGIRYQSGYMGAFTFMWTMNSWRIRSRIVYASPFFRNSRGKRSEYPAGGYVDVKRRSKTGLQLGLAYYVAASYSSLLNNEIEIGLGWNLRFWKFRLYSELSIKEQSQSEILKNMSAQVRWQGDKLSAKVRLNRHWREGWRCHFNLSFKVRREWNIGTKIDFVNRNDVFLVNLGIRTAVKVNNNKILLGFLINDLPGEWENGPGAASDMALDIRWIINFK